MNLLTGVLLGLAIALIPLVVAYWPRAVAFLDGLRHGAGAIPVGVTPFVATLLSGPGQMDLLTCGLMWIVARPRVAPPRGPKGAKRARGTKGAAASPS